MLLKPEFFSGIANVLIFAITATESFGTFNPHSF
jgi:hypothetical protein